MRGFAILVLILGASMAATAQRGPADVTARARGADRIVVAHVLEVHAAFETNQFNDQLIVSNLLLEVEETLKGRSGATAYVVVEGGTVGDLTLRVSDMPSLEKGDRAVFFLNPESAGRHVPNGRGGGILKVGAGDRIEGIPLTLSAVKTIVGEASSQNRGGR